MNPTNALVSTYFASFVTAFLFAFVVKYAIRFMLKVRVKYWPVYIALCLTSFCLYGAGFLLARTGVFGADGFDAPARLAILGAGVFLEAWLLSWLVQGEDGTAIRYPQAILVSTVHAMAEILSLVGLLVIDAVYRALAHGAAAPA